jgi:hypothetical protein
MTNSFVVDRYEVRVEETASQARNCFLKRTYQPKLPTDYKQIRSPNLAAGGLHWNSCSEGKLIYCCGLNIVLLRIAIGNNSKGLQTGTECRSPPTWWTD